MVTAQESIVLCIDCGVVLQTEHGTMDKQLR